VQPQKVETNQKSLKIFDIRVNFVLETKLKAV
jgi:hypothetical protein